MASINDIIKREVNPFDLVNLRTGNFWGQSQELNSMVESIHQEVITETENLLNLVVKDNSSRTILLIGESGSGKSYLLGRVKRQLNPKAFFAYITPWVDDNYIWRHILRATVDSLIQVSDGQQESQLILWLKNLSAFTQGNLKNKPFNDSIWQLLLNDRQKFIKQLKRKYQTAGIYNPDHYFGVLHDLTDPELYPLACEWLRGDDLSEESMQTLRVKQCIDTEDAAKQILANFGKISTATQPIVLCFDQVESIPNFLSNPQSIFRVNTTIHNENIYNFLIIITLVSHHWKQTWDHIPHSDQARIDREIFLKPIDLKQAEALWYYQLQTIYQQAQPQPESPIFPLNIQLLEKNFPGGKTNPRNALILGRSEYQKYKVSLLNIRQTILIDLPQQPQKQPINFKVRKNDFSGSFDSEEKDRAEFQLLWQQEYKKYQGKLSKISLLSSPELVRMLQEALEALQLQSVKSKMIAGKYASYSLSYQHRGSKQKIGVVWTEDSNMTNFFHVMNACHKAVQQNLCQKLVLIRISNVGKPQLKSYEIYSQIFNNTQHIHIKPTIQSVHHLATYHSLVNSALCQELFIGKKNINLQTLQSFIRECKVLHKCVLLQDLGIITKPEPNDDSNFNRNAKQDFRPIKEFLLNVITTQAFLGVPILISQAASQFPNLKETETHLLIDLLCQEKKVKIVNPHAEVKEQVICLLN
ncbi:ATP-binding protein [Anabaenopsis sp. FSS-46]|uniref:ATP-binding protein n=1 Tax=Anabaenopsis sp. FSS-46 TaxID=2971766 RepID=UPI002476C6C1|nr:ATP-binding protein [Anabaenopsis sp. FSS-46]MDH6098272.1 ATP-binding protein [Anabaenopsis sp. FSS-46]